MASLQISKNQTVIDTVDLASPRVSIGRHQRNDIILDDPRCSPFHAEIQQTLSGPVLSDRGSTHGTLLNNRAIRQAPLSNGDAIQVGDLCLTYLESSPPYKPHSTPLDSSADSRTSVQEQPLPAPKSPSADEQSSDEEKVTDETKPLVFSPSAAEQPETKKVKPDTEDASPEDETGEMEAPAESDKPAAAPSPQAARKAKGIRMKLSGSIVASSAERLDRLFDDALLREPHTLTVDFTKVPSVTGGGWKAMLRCLAETRRAGIKVIFAGMSDDVEKGFQALRLYLLVDKQ